MPTITIELTEDEQSALEEMARQEITTQEGAAVKAMRLELQRRKFLKLSETVAENGQAKHYKCLDE